MIESGAISFPWPMFYLLIITLNSRSTGSIPVPAVLHYDATSENALQQPYVLMQRLKGESLHTARAQMDLHQTIQLAKTIARTIAHIHAQPVPVGIGPLHATEKGLLIGKYTDFGEYECPADYSPPMTINQFLEDRFTEFANQWPHLPLLSSLYLGLRDISRGLNFPEPTRSVLFHRDFYPRNIIVHPFSTDNSAEVQWEVSGVIDWDDCEVAPVEIAYACPAWLWAHPDEESDQRGIDEIDCDPDAPVLDDDCRAIKEAFMDEIERLLPGYMDVVRDIRRTPLKTLWNFARSGLHASESARMAEKMVKDFPKIE